MSKSTLQPLSDRILVVFDKAPEKSAGGIFLPETIDREIGQEGTIAAVGPGKFLGYNASGKPQTAPVAVKPGDRFIIQKFGGIDLTEDGVAYKLLGQDDVLAVVKK